MYFLTFPMDKNIYDQAIFSACPESSVSILQPGLSDFNLSYALIVSLFQIYHTISLIAKTQISLYEYVSERFYET